MHIFSPADCSSQLHRPRNCLQNNGGICGRADDDHSDAHVERAEHFVVGDVADALHQAEDRRFGPRAAVDLDRDAVGKDAWDILEKAAARDMREAVY